MDKNKIKETAEQKTAPSPRMQALTEDLLSILKNKTQKHNLPESFGFKKELFNAFILRNN